jgi:hypothetical protein
MERGHRPTTRCTRRARRKRRTLAVFYGRVSDDSNEPQGTLLSAGGHGSRDCSTTDPPTWSRFISEIVPLVERNPSSPLYTFCELAPRISQALKATPTHFSILRRLAEGPLLIIRHFAARGTDQNAGLGLAQEVHAAPVTKWRWAVRFIRPLDAPPGVRRGDTLDQRFPYPVTLFGQRWHRATRLPNARFMNGSQIQSLCYACYLFA